MDIVSELLNKTVIDEAKNVMKLWKALRLILMTMPRVRMRKKSISKRG